MVHRSIAATAVLAGQRATSVLLRTMRDNRLANDYYRAAIAAQLDGTVGHVHGTGTTAFTATFQDRIRTTTGVNDQLSFGFQSPSYGFATYTVTLSAGLRTFSAHATLIQDAFRAAVDAGSPASVPIEVVYDSDAESKKRGLWSLRHTGSVEPRLFQLLFGTGAGAARSHAQTIGFPKKDQKGGLAYTGDSGFIDGLAQELFSLGQGGLLTSNDFVSSPAGSKAFTTVKFKNKIVPASAFQDGSVAGGGSGGIADGALRGEKFNDATSVAAVSITAGNFNNFNVTVPNGGAGRVLQVAPYCTDPAGILPHLVEVTSITYVGPHYTVRLTNLDSVSRALGPIVY